MQGIHKLNIAWTDDNHAHVQDPDTGREFDITVRWKTNMFVGGKPVKSRLYVNGPLVRKKAEELTFHKQIAWAKDYFLPTLRKILNRDVNIKFSRKAGCGCGCSPGFIIDDSSFPFDIWMDAE